MSAHDWFVTLFWLVVLLAILISLPHVDAWIDARAASREDAEAKAETLNHLSRVGLPDAVIGRLTPRSVRVAQQSRRLSPDDWRAIEEELG